MESVFVRNLILKKSSIEAINNSKKQDFDHKFNHLTKS